MEEKLLSKKEVAEWLGVSIASVDRRMADGSLKFVRFGKSVRIRKSEVLRMADAAEKRTDDPAMG